jgi:predicted RNase H-like HicB family nuclease
MVDMSQVEYTVILEPNQDEPGYTATVPALPGCISAGDTLEEALENARDAIELWIRMARNKGEPVPQDFTVVSKVTVGA